MPKVAAGNVVVDTATAGVATVSERAFAADTNGPPFATVVASVAVIDTGNVPAAVGVPEIAPAVVMVRPAGRPVAVNV